MKRRLLVSYLSITAFVLIVLEIPLGVSYATSVEGRLVSDLQHDAFALAIRAQEPLEQLDVADQASRTTLRELVDRYHRDTGARVVIVDRDGFEVADTDPTRPLRDFSSRPEIAHALEGAEVSGRRSSRTLGTELLYVALPIGSADGLHGAVRVSYPASVVADRQGRVWLLLAATGGVVLGIVFIVSLWLAQSVARPLNALERAAGELGGGDLGARAAITEGPDEVRMLAESFNRTAGRLEQLVAAQRGFVADASHQLRTPLAAMRLRLENLEAEVGGAGAEDLDGALAEVARLSRLVDGLLALARAEQAVAAPVPVSLAELLETRRDAWSAFAAERGVHIESDISADLVVLATAGRLEQVVDNVLNNALEVTPAGRSVRLLASRAGGFVEMRVSDDGPGMTPEARARAFDRFWQSPEARRDGRASGHFGLGLPIVRELVVGDGGDVVLEPSRTGGLEVIVRLRPAAAAATRQLSPATSG